MPNWEYAIGRIYEKPLGEAWHIHPKAGPPFYSNAQVPYRRLRPPGPGPEPSSTIRHRKRKATDYDFPNSSVVRRPSILAISEDSAEGEDSGTYPPLPASAKGPLGGVGGGIFLGQRAHS